MRNLAADIALEEALQRDDLDGARDALAQGANPNDKIAVHEHVLLAAAYNGSYGMVDLLLNAGADVNVRDKDGQNIYHKLAQGMAIEDGERCRILRRIRPLNPSLAAKADDYGRCPLHFAAVNDLVSVIHALVVECGAEVNPQARNGETPTRIAAGKGKKDAVSSLLMLGVDASEKNEEGRDLHAIASHLKQWASVDAIEHYKKLADVDAETAQPDAAVLCNPKLWRQADVFLQALEKRGEYLTLEQLTEKDNTQRAPLHYAHMCGKLPALLRHVFAHEAPSLDLFVDSKRQLTEMGAFVLRAQSCELACEALRGAGPDAIRALYKALPEEGRAQVSQYHALLAQAEQAFLDTTVRR